MQNYSYAVLTIMVIAIITRAGGQMSDEECQKQGFNKPLCSSCDKLESYQLNELEDKCQQCCVEDVQAAAGKQYPKARLEVCTCMYPSLPQIEAFIKKHSQKFPNLIVKHINGQAPIIKMTDSNGNVDQVLSIVKWDTDTILDFLQTHLLD